MTFIQMRSASINYAYLQSDGWRYESILKFNKHLIIIIMPITHHSFVHISIVESLWWKLRPAFMKCKWFLVQEKVSQILWLFMEIYRVIRSLTKFRKIDLIKQILFYLVFYVLFLDFITNKMYILFIQLWFIMFLFLFY